MAGPPSDPAEVQYLLEADWHRRQCPLCRTIVAAYVGGGSLVRTEPWACAACGSFELTGDAALMLDRIRFEDPARSAKLGRLIRRDLGKLDEPIDAVEILRAEAADRP